MIDGRHARSGFFLCVTRGHGMVGGLMMFQVCHTPDQSTPEFAHYISEGVAYGGL